MTEAKSLIVAEEKGEDLKILRSLITAHKDFPKKGILFQARPVALLQSLVHISPTHRTSSYLPQPSRDRGACFLLDSEACPNSSHALHSCCSRGSSSTCNKLTERSISLSGWKLAVRCSSQQRSRLSTTSCVTAAGFLLGPVMAARLGCAFVPIRKKGKLPGECVGTSYVKVQLPCSNVHVQPSAQQHRLPRATGIWRR
jgi:hypothetical protein